MPTSTTTYSLSKPIVGGDADVWGTELNNNADKLDDVLDGTLPITPAAGNDIDIVGTNAATNTVTTLLTLNSQSSGTPAAGIGSALAFAAETAAGNTEVGVVLEAVTTDVTAASEDFDLVIKTMAAGAAAAERVRIGSSGLTVGTVQNAGTLALSATGANIITASTNGSERYRIGSAGQLGIGGANFGTAGQVLRSGGASAATEWAAPVAWAATQSASGTAVDFTGIPAWATSVVVLLDGVSLSGTDNVLIQLGDSGGFLTSGYDTNYSSLTSGGNSFVASTSGFQATLSNAAHSLIGSLTLHKAQSSNRWVGNGGFYRTTALSDTTCKGVAPLSGVLTQVRVTRTGTNTFDAGNITVGWL